MSQVFTMSGNKSRTFHGAHSVRPLEIRGTWNMQGPQPVGDGGVPTWAADLFDSMPDVTQIAVSTKTHGVVWTRPEPEQATCLDDADLSHRNSGTFDPLYTVDQMRAYALEARSAERERCAKLCDAYQPIGREGPETTAYELGLQIRTGIHGPNANCAEPGSPPRSV